jgi:hypothetical protein
VRYHDEAAVKLGMIAETNNNNKHKENTTTSQKEISETSTRDHMNIAEQATRGDFDELKK